MRSGRPHPEGSTTWILYTSSHRLSVESIEVLSALSPQPTSWTRLEKWDARPGILLLTLQGVLDRLDPAAYEELSPQLRRLAGQNRWQEAYAKVIGAFQAIEPRPSLVILEGLESGRRAFAACLAHLLPALVQSTDPLTSVEVDTGTSRRALRRLGATAPSAGHKGIEALAAGGYDEALGLSLSAEAARYLRTLAADRPAGIAAVLAAAQLLGTDAVGRLCQSSRTMRQLLTRVGNVMLAEEDPSTRPVLAAALHLGLWHPALWSPNGREPPGQCRPWFIELESGWWQLRPVWRQWLRTQLPPPLLNRQQSEAVASGLARKGLNLAAVELYLAAGRQDAAIETLSSVAGELVAHGCADVLKDLETGSFTIEEPRRQLRLLRRPGDLQRNIATPEAPEPAGFLPRIGGTGEDTGDAPDRRLSPDLCVDAETSISAQPSDANSERPDPAQSEQAARASHRHAVQASALDVYLLGDTRLNYAGRSLETWTSGRGRAVFEYLVAHRHVRTSREKLMSIFWPEAPPDKARNSLNVAVHGVRRSLRELTAGRPVIVYQQESYLLDPELDIWVDLEVFDQRLKNARHLAASHEDVAAAAEYSSAIELYGGEFLADQPYEEWATVPREHLRLEYLDAVNQLSSIRYQAGDFHSCIELCNRILACDACREDIHTRVMLSYCRLGLPELAVRQYHRCASALRAELNMTTGGAITELFRRIQRRDHVPDEPPSRVGRLDQF